MADVDEKSISFENDPTALSSYGGTSSPGDSTHVWVKDWDKGTTEPGSSGSPLFDSNHRVIGQLHGGGAACGQWQKLGKGHRLSDRPRSSDDDLNRRYRSC